MKAKPVKTIEGGYRACEVAEADHVWLKLPGPSGHICLPIILHGSRKDHAHPVWSWNGDTEKPTLKPSILTKCGHDGKITCHSWVNDGKAIFQPDSTHELAGQTVDLLEVDI
jgi:hypothetical protein